jgi:hypothetical protein
VLELFPRQEVVGVFRGFREDRGLEFHADLTLPYRVRLHNVPMHGQFLLVQLENPDEAVLGRICSLSAEGMLSSSSGEQYSIRAMSEARQVPDHLREEYLRYRVNIRVLGVVRLDDDTGLVFAPSHRRLPHVGSPVAFPSDDVLRRLVGHYDGGAELGFYALGEFLYAGDDGRVTVQPWVQVRNPKIAVRFPIQHLVARRTFVFARAGYGKSNLNKLLFSTLYSSDCTVEKRGGRRVPVGTVVFDPDGEYFWPDDKGRPGLCDVPELKDKVVVFTARQAPSEFYGSFVASGVKLDIRRLRPSDVVSIALSPDKQDQQNVRKLRGVNPSDWADLVDLVARERNSADLDAIKRLLHLEDQQDAEALAARANMTQIVQMLHDQSSQMMDILFRALADGKLCVIDVSQLRGGPSLVLSGLILRQIFDHNQEEFVKAEPRTIPTIAVVEEAQTVLNERASASGPYIEWVKEGRKYDLGAILITQQPGSISTEILSQGDNWFIFHLLSEGDLRNLRHANAHFSDDILSSLLNEPIPGQGIFWSGVSEMKYPIPLRVLLFEELHRRQDLDYTRGAITTYAGTLSAQFRESTGRSEAPATVVSPEPGNGEMALTGDVPGAEGLRLVETDPFRAAQKRAIDALGRDETFRRSIDAGGLPYGTIVGILKNALPDTMNDRDTMAFRLVPSALDELLGPQQKNWDTEMRESKGGKRVRFVVKLPRRT